MKPPLAALALLAPLAVHGAFVRAPTEGRTAWERATGFPAAQKPSASHASSSSTPSFLYYDKGAHAHATATYDGRSMRIDNQSTILLGGSVHYMR